MKVLQNGRLLRFSKRTDFWCTFSWSICNQNGYLIGCIQSSSFQSYDDTHINHGKTLSAKRNSGRKQKPSEIDHRTLKRIVTINHRSTTAKVTAELNIHLKNMSQKTVWWKCPKSDIHGRAEVAKPQISENTAKRWKRGHLMTGNTSCDQVSHPSQLPTSGWVYVWTSPQEAWMPGSNYETWSQILMIWAAVSSIVLVLYLLWMVKLLPVTTWTFEYILWSRCFFLTVMQFFKTTIRHTHSQKCSLLVWGAWRCTLASSLASKIAQL